MDTGRERFLASLLGGGGTVAGVFAYQVVPDLDRMRRLSIRPLNGSIFLLVIFLIGAAGGFVGHRLFLSMKGPLEARALMVGTLIGLVIAVVGWSVTYVFRSVMFPFRPFAGMETLIRIWLPNALLAGPVGGVLTASFVVRRLRRRSRMNPQ